MGTIGHHHATCCLSFGQVQPTPPDQPVFLFVNGECRVRHLHRRHIIYGLDANGPITLALCRDSTIPAPELDCCTLTAVGPSTTGNGYTPVPTQMTGAYQCPTKAGMKTGTFSLKPKGGR